MKTYYEIAYKILAYAYHKLIDGKKIYRQDMITASELEIAEEYYTWVIDNLIKQKYIKMVTEKDDSTHFQITYEGIEYIHTNELIKKEIMKER